MAGVRLFVGNLPYSANEQALRQLFGQAGEVRSVVIPTDRETGRPRGFAFVDMAAEAEARQAISQFDGYTLDGRRLRVSRAEEREGRRRPPAGFPEPAWGPPLRYAEPVGAKGRGGARPRRTERKPGR